MHTANTLVVAFVVGLVGCASAGQSGSTTMTAASVSSSAAPAGEEGSESTPPHEAAARDESPREELPGQLVCRTKSRDDGATELRLEWKGNSATGTLRTIAPSGEQSVRHVTAQHYQSAIIVDDEGEQDLVSHAAVVAPSGGKQVMRVGARTAVPCE